jgi:hypothetical protein
MVYFGSQHQRNRSVVLLHWFWVNSTAECHSRQSMWQELLISWWTGNELSRRDPNSQRHASYNPWLTDDVQRCYTEMGNVSYWFMFAFLNVKYQHIRASGIIIYDVRRVTAQMSSGWRTKLNFSTLKQLALSWATLWWGCPVHRRAFSSFLGLFFRYQWHL